jgi:hypothetical protein
MGYRFLTHKFTHWLSVVAEEAVLTKRMRTEQQGVAVVELFKDGFLPQLQ